RDGGGPPLGLLIDGLGVHFDSSKPSRLERILATDPLDDGAILARARDGMERLKAAHLSKYNAFDPALPVPEPGYVLVIDQTQGDASIEWGGASARSEERRVGKECRSGWSPGQEMTKIVITR